MPEQLHGFWCQGGLRVGSFFSTDFCGTTTTWGGLSHIWVTRSGPCMREEQQINAVKSSSIKKKLRKNRKSKEVDVVAFNEDFWEAWWVLCLTGANRNFMGKDVSCGEGGKVCSQRGPKEGKLWASLGKHLQLVFLPALSLFPWILSFCDVFCSWPVDSSVITESQKHVKPSKSVYSILWRSQVSL